MSKVMRAVLVLIYNVVVFWPLFLVQSILLTTFAALSGMVISPAAGSFWGRMWSKVAILLSLSRVTVQGAERLDKNKSYVFVANHASAFDIFLVYGYLGRDIRWVMKKELMSVPFLGWACKNVGHIPIDRSNSSAAKDSIEVAKQRMEGGVSVVFFPEGTRSRTGKMGRFKKGAFLLALELQADIVPVTINGAFSVQPPRSKLIYPGRLSLTIHDAISVKDYKLSELNELASKSKGVIESAIV